MTTKKKVETDGLFLADPDNGVLDNYYTHSSLDGLSEDLISSGDWGDGDKFTIYKMVKVGVYVYKSGLVKV